LEDNVQVGLARGPAVQVRIDDPAANFDGGIVPEIVRRFENDPDRVQGLVLLRLFETRPAPFACGCAE
jgi:hypothetical protein